MGPLEFLMPLLFSVVIYWTVRLTEDFDRFLLFCMVVLLLAFVMNSFGMWAGSMVPAATASLLAPSVFLVFLLVAGYYVNPENIPSWISWLKYVGPMFYGFNAMIYTQFKDVDFYCKDDQFIHYEDTVRCPGGLEITVESDTCPTTSGNQIIDQFSADELELWQNVLILLAYIVVFRGLTY